MKYLLATLLLASAPVSAQNATRAQHISLFNAGAACLPALPRYDTNVRKRPLAVMNEGTVPSFVTCNYIVNENAADHFGGVEYFQITAKNQSNVTAVVQCMGVVGVDDGNARYYPQSVTLLPGDRKRMTWTAIAYGFPNGWEDPVQMSCLLPVLTGLNEGRVHWNYEDLR